MVNTVSPSLVAAIEKLALAGEQVGFSIEQMIDLPDARPTVKTLLDLIAWRLEGSPSFVQRGSARICNYCAG